MKVARMPERDGAPAQYARELLSRCEAGRVRSVTAVEEYVDGTYMVVGSATTDRLRCAGALLEAAITRLSGRDD